MLEHMILYLQYAISSLIELVQERVPNKLQSPGPREAAAGIHIPNRSIILGLWCHFANFCALPFLPAPLCHIPSPTLLSPSRSSASQAAAIPPAVGAESREGSPSSYSRVSPGSQHQHSREVEMGMCLSPDAA